MNNPKFDFEINQKGQHEMTNREALVFIEKAKNLIKEVPDMVKPAQRGLLSKDKPLVIPNL